MTEAKNIVEGLESKKKTMVFQVLNITDSYDQDLQHLVQEKVYKAALLNYENLYSSQNCKFPKECNV